MMRTDRQNTCRALAVVVGTLLAMPTAAAAQQGQHRHGQDQESEAQGMHGMMMGMQRPGQMMEMMGMMAGPSPTMILEQRETLELTEDQVQKLEALQERAARTRTRHTEAMQSAHRELAEQAKDPDLDLDAYESRLRSLAEEHVAMHVAMARVGQEAREMLTAEQREQLQVGMRFMRGMMMRMVGGQMNPMGPGGGMGSMMGRMRCPMMGGSAHPSP